MINRILSRFKVESVVHSDDYREDCANGAITQEHIDAIRKLIHKERRVIYRKIHGMDIQGT